jgi:hypothetical protein
MTCSAPVCGSPCGHSVCPYALSRARAEWRRAWVAGRVVGPLQRYECVWLLTVQDVDPWRGAEVAP